MATMTVRRVGSVLVVAHTSDDPSDEEWASFIDETVALGVREPRLLVVTEGGGPSSKQRGAWAERLAHPVTRSAVVTSNPIHRGVMTALVWLRIFKDAQVFAPADYSDAVEFIAEEEERPAIREAMRECRAALGLAARVG